MGRLLQILGGADLFLQGVILPGGDSLQFGAGDLMAVKVTGNPLPFAVGTMEVSSEQAARAGGCQHRMGGGAMLFPALQFVGCHCMQM